ncbi:type II toxin-antitoxin system ParD family antitoxin [Thauera sp.]|uniref:type II toxin-antitoxin system ParD family antitoxin n=1 Tax=Thauera sp. TaxID=1905334 RepID=UPI002C75F3FD|nr:type II toxin-antitoxin system ParD family antitoxin [Thauera sp.]HRP24021.1 type II toxin-antitoxin system ParD family antitoxin [Thauera sp.]
MSVVRKTITLTDQQDRWIKAQIEAGHYTNDSEYIRDLIRREQAGTAQTEAIRAALIEGENSGPAQPFDLEAFKARMNAEHR